MLRKEIEDVLADKLAQRIEEANVSILKKIGNNIRIISTLTPSQAYQLGQIMKYGGSYEEIVKELARISGKNIQDIYKIFGEVAKSNKQFAKQFYRYRGIDYIPYKKDIALQNQVKSIATMTANKFLNIANTRAVGYVFKDSEGKRVFKNIEQTYKETIDRAILSVAQGKESFYAEMRDVLQQLGGSGLVQYESGRTRRLDSAIRMNILDGIRQLNNENTIRFGKEYDADGIEISVHSNPAPDHADIQGRQFSDEEYDKLENGEIAKDYKGRIYDGADKRRISEYNCYHKIFTIVLGVSKPLYTDEQLKKIQEDNEKGFEYEGKHYTNYEGTQLQRRIETEIRKQKDTNILAKASGDEKLVEKSELKIRQLTNKYNDLCKQSGLRPQIQRMNVRGYKKSNVVQDMNKKEGTFDEIIESLKNKKITIKDSVINMKDKELRDRVLGQLDNLSNKYNHNRISKENLTLGKEDLGYAIGQSSYFDHSIKLGSEYFDNKKMIIDTEDLNIERGWHYRINEKDYDLYTITHEYGHIMEYEYMKEKLLKQNTIPLVSTKKQRRLVDKELADTLIDRARRKAKDKMTITQFKQKYWSNYAMSKRNFEWFAESFTKAELTNDSDIWIDTFREWLNDFYK